MDKIASPRIAALLLALPLLMLGTGYGLAQQSCTIMGEEVSVSSGQACPSDLHTTLSGLQIERTVAMTDATTGETSEVTELQTFKTFIELYDRSGFGKYLKGETPPKLHGPGVREAAMTVFAVSDQMLGEEAASRLTHLATSQNLDDAKKVRDFVGAHILTVPETHRSMWNGQGTRTTLTGAHIQYDSLTGGERINGVPIFKNDVIAKNGVIQVMSGLIVPVPD